MKGLGIFAIFILFTTILIPMIIISSCDIIKEEPDINKIKYVREVENPEVVRIYNVSTQKVEELELEEYIKGVVTAEMPAEFHIEALKAQAVAARTYTLYRIENYKDGHPHHPEAALCNSVHCQAWLSMDDIARTKPKNWMYNYWSKIEEAVDSTKGQIITYKGDLIEPLFHSTSGGMTDNSEDVFVSAQPYHRSVDSPYEDGAPRQEESKTLSVDEFIKIIKDKYPGATLTKENLPDKIKIAERTDSGKIKKLLIDKEMVSGRDIRTIFDLNSTNFKITMKSNNITFHTVGYGHGVGMSQWGAHGMGNQGSTYIEILKHYYTGVDIENIGK